MKNFTNDLKYRPDIDGLRAVAILSVVAFHAFPDALAGGFIGVDIFFVISGFLISGILFSELDDDAFSYLRFYIRRIRRIFPALVVVLAVVLGIGWAVLFSSEYQSLGRHAFAASIFGSNILLWREAGYFDMNAAYKPLLHLWSLGVEEQFYVFWPLVLGFAWRRWNIPGAILLIGAVSFAVSLYVTGRDADTAFYMPFTRCWEFMIGACAAWLDFRRFRVPEPLAVALSLAGLLLILSGLAWTTRNSPFPGWLASLPTLGTALLIGAGPRGVVNRLLLSHPAMVGVGLISYPLYLWHWPLLSYFRIMEGGVLDPAQAAAAVALAFLLAFLTYRFIEKSIRAGFPKPSPARPAGFRSGWGLSATLCVLLALTGTAGLTVDRAGGKPKRAVNRLNVSDNRAGDVFPNMARECGLTGEEKNRITFCLADARSTPVFALLGDSKAAVLFPGLVRNSDETGRWMMIGGNGNYGAPVTVVSDAEPYRSFQALTVAASDAIVRNPAIRVVVLTTALRQLFRTNENNYLEDLPASPYYGAALDGLDRMIGKLVAAGKLVVLTMDNPTLADPLKCMTRRTGIGPVDFVFAGARNSHCSLTIDENVRLQKPYRDLLDALSRKWGGSLVIYDPVNALCLKEKNLCPSERDGHLLYSYTDHISDYASDLIGRELNPLIRSLVSARDQVKVDAR